MKLNEYLTENGVKLMIKGSGENYPPRQTNGLGMYDYKNKPGKPTTLVVG